MALPPLEVEQGRTNVIGVGDERERALVEQAPSTSVASITFTGGDTSWGEFLDWHELLAVHEYLGSIITSERAQGRRP